MGKYVSERTRQLILQGRLYRTEAMEQAFWDLWDKAKDPNDSFNTTDETKEIFDQAKKFRVNKFGCEEFLNSLIAEDNKIEEDKRQSKIDRQWEAYSGKPECMPQLPTPDIFIVKDNEFEDLRHDVVVVYPKETGIPPISLTKCGLFNITDADCHFTSNNLNINLKGNVHTVKASDIEEIDYPKLDLEAMREEHSRLEYEYRHNPEVTQEPITPIIYVEDE